MEESFKKISMKHYNHELDEKDEMHIGSHMGIDVNRDFTSFLHPMHRKSKK